MEIDFETIQSSTEEVDDQTTVSLNEETNTNDFLYFAEANSGSEEDEEDENELWIETPRINRTFLLKDPRVMLAFLRFVETFNEFADLDDIIVLRAIPRQIISNIEKVPLVQNPPPEFQAEAAELLERLNRFSDRNMYYSS